MTLKNLAATAILIVLLGLPSLCVAQSSGSDCDFYRYKPLALSKLLIDAAIKRVEPKWPPMGHGIGKVNVKILVDRVGNVVKACVVSGHPLLRESARQAALGWKFKPDFGFNTKQKWKYAQSQIEFVFRRE